MNNTKYTYAVARIRANETGLLTDTDYDMLINASDKESVIRILNDKGWNINAKHIYKSLEDELSKVWDLISESVPDITLLNSLITENDFFNLKAALKANFSNLPIDNYYIKPCTFDTTALTYAVTHNEFKDIPEHIRYTAKKAYNSYAENSSGQDSEIIIDRACLETCVSFSEKSGSELLKKIMIIKCVQANIKTAKRCLLRGKTVDFTKEALAVCPGIDNDELIETVNDDDKLIQFISKTPFSYMKNAVTESFTEFENFCYDYSVNLTKASKWDIDGPDPVVSYWIIKSNEIRNARVILSAKANDLTVENLRKRVRGINV